MSLQQQVQQSAMVNSVMQKRVPQVSAANIQTGMPSQHSMSGSDDLAMMKLIGDVDGDSKPKLTNIWKSDIYFQTALDRLSAIWAPKGQGPLGQDEGEKLKLQKTYGLAYGRGVSAVPALASALREAHQHLDSWRLVYGEPAFANMDDSLIQEINGGNLNSMGLSRKPLTQLFAPLNP